MRTEEVIREDRLFFRFPKTIRQVKNPEIFEHYSNISLKNAIFAVK